MIRERLPEVGTFQLSWGLGRIKATSGGREGGGEANSQFEIPEVGRSPPAQDSESGSKEE